MNSCLHLYVHLEVKSQHFSQTNKKKNKRNVKNKKLNTQFLSSTIFDMYYGFLYN